jgi:hypothetical protein
MVTKPSVSRALIHLKAALDGMPGATPHVSADVLYAVLPSSLNIANKKRTSGSLM